MKIMLLGSTGLLGTAIEKVCKDRNVECVSIMHKQLEITNPLELNEVIKRFMPTVVINTVAIPGIDQCELEPQRAFDVNSIAVLNLAKICEKNKITLMQISSSSVFDGTKDDFYAEKDEVNPTGVYSASKYISECFVKNICSKHYIIRLPMLFGRRRNKPARFVDKVIEKIKRDEEIKASIDRIDTPTYTLDAANIILYLIEKENSGIYHVSNSGKTNIYSFVKKLCELMESNAKIIKVKENDFKSIAYKPLKLALKSVKIEPLRKWEDALHEFVTRELK
ncbi:MAG: NAD(P)-dependent oxidoreductase [Thermoplasmatales archaeon]|nr:NAD(P)-dependent oxidoreductase [Thermoplasmatales archaeon]